VTEEGYGEVVAERSARRRWTPGLSRRGSHLHLGNWRATDANGPTRALGLVAVLVLLTAAVVVQPANPVPPRPPVSAGAYGGQSASPSLESLPAGPVLRATREPSISPVAPSPFRLGRTLPDVYYVILDGYARADVLSEIYGFDNEPFLAELERRGFYVARESYSNYAATHLSLASALNERYLDRKRDVPRNLIRRSSVAETFRRLGYEYVLGRTIWRTTAESPIADHTFGLEVTVADPLDEDALRSMLLNVPVPWPSLGDAHLAAFDGLELVPQIDAPTFTLAHMILPHPPYVLDRDGRIVKIAFSAKGTWETPSDRRGYLEQVRFANERILQAIDRIVESSSVEPVIIIQGDHGVFGGAGPTGDRGREMGARMAILNAYRVPPGAARLLYPSISPVNTFRVLFPALFSMERRLLPDRHFYYGERDREQLQEVEPAFIP